MARGTRSQVRRIWTERLAAFARAGLTAREFCRREGVSQPSFYQWRRRLVAEPPLRRVVQRRSSASRHAPAPAFFPVVLRDAAPRARVEIALPGGAVVRLLDVDPHTLRAAIVAAGSLSTPGEASSC